MTTSIRPAARALAHGLVLIVAGACESNGSNAADTGERQSGGSGSRDQSASGSSSKPADGSRCIDDVQGEPSPLCEDCVCKKCPEVAVDCDTECWDLFQCLHVMCDADEANLDSCAAGPCSAHAAGLAAAKAIASCAYRSADRGQARENRSSCLISCNFGPIPAAN